MLDGEPEAAGEGEVFDVVVALVAEVETLLAAGTGVAVSPVFVDRGADGDTLGLLPVEAPATDPELLTGPVFATTALAKDEAPATAAEDEGLAPTLGVAVADADARA